MNVEEPTPQGSESSEPPASNAPEDFIGYVKWRKTGEPPVDAAAPQQPAAAAVETPPPAKTEPQSGAEEEHQEEEEGQEGQEGATGRRGGQRQRRIDRLTRENAELKAQLATAAPPKPQEPPKFEPSPGEPRLEQFESLEAYQRALTKWNILEVEKERQAEADQKAAFEAWQKQQADWQSKQQAARKAHRDYDDVIESTPPPEGPGVIAGLQAMHDDPAGAEILYYLGTHPDELKRIAALQPIAAVREIGRLSATLSPPVANGKQRLSDAPPPPPPRGKPAPIKESLDDPEVQKDFRRWERLRMAQLRNK